MANQINIIYPGYDFIKVGGDCYRFVGFVNEDPDTVSIDDNYVSCDECLETINNHKYISCPVENHRYSPCDDNSSSSP
jgi:hypothetical protein